MRAPTRAELAATAQRLFAADKNITVDTTDAVFYTDADLSIMEVDAQRIATRSLERLAEQNLIDRSLDEQSAARLLGATITDPKAWLDPEAPSSSDIRRAIGAKSTLPLHGMANLAWYSRGAVGVACLNGESRTVNQRCREKFAQICVAGEAQSRHIHALVNDSEGTEFLEWMLKNAAFDLAHDIE